MIKINRHCFFKTPKMFWNKKHYRNVNIQPLILIIRENIHLLRTSYEKLIPWNVLSFYFYSIPLFLCFCYFEEVFSLNKSKTALPEREKRGDMYICNYRVTKMKRKWNFKWTHKIEIILIYSLFVIFSTEPLFTLFSSSFSISTLINIVMSSQHFYYE